MSKKPGASNRETFLSKVLDRLTEMRSKLLDEVDTDQKAQREENKDEGMDAYDLASVERDREISFILSDRERLKINQIDEALARIADGSYGICESCGLEIAEERLDALPFTRLCRDCQQDQEREARTQGRVVEMDDRGYRKVGSTDGDEENT